MFWNFEYKQDVSKLCFINHLRINYTDAVINIRKIHSIVYINTLYNINNYSIPPPIGALNLGKIG